MKYQISLLVMGVALMISGCHKEDPVAPSNLTAQAAHQPETAMIQEINWNLITLEGSTYEFPADGPWFRLVSRDNDVTGHTACNELTAAYQLTGQQLRFVNVASTRIYCPDVTELEQRYLQALRLTDSYQLQSDTLVLTSGEQALARFVADRP